MVVHVRRRSNLGCIVHLPGSSWGFHSWVKPQKGFVLSIKEDPCQADCILAQAVESDRKSRFAKRKIISPNIWFSHHL